MGEAAKKKPYEGNAEKLKKEYQVALDKFKADGGVAGKRRAEKAAGKKEKEPKHARKGERDPNKPKKPMTGYWLWLGENRAALTKELGTGKGSEVAKLGARSGELSPRRRKPPSKRRPLRSRPSTTRPWWNTRKRLVMMLAMMTTMARKRIEKGECLARRVNMEFA